MARKRQPKVTILQRGGEKYHATLEYWTRRFFADSCSTRLANTLRVRIEVRATKLDADTNGCAYYEPIHDPKAKTYTIILDREATLIKQVGTLFHELQHVLQYAQRRLAHLSRGGEGGRSWLCEDGQRRFFPYSTTDCWSSPWEVEARMVAASWMRHFSTHWNEKFRGFGEERYEMFCARQLPA